jgi:hypothetical protein
VVDVGEFVKTRTYSNNKYLGASCACATGIICMLVDSYGLWWTLMNNKKYCRLFG